MFKWIKKVHLFKPSGQFDWMQTHAQVPFTLILGNVLRIYFSTREKADKSGQFKSYSGFIDVDKNNFSNILRISKSPILELGKPGEFDEYGIMAGSIIRKHEKFLLYYCGWTRCKSVPYNWAIGIAESLDGTNFKKLGLGPLLGPTLNEPYLQACPIVYKDLNEKWHMFYLSGVKWFDHKNKKESQYLLMHAESLDGYVWERDGVPIIETLVENECQTSSSIIFKNGCYHMFFSYRYGLDFRNKLSNGYRIGYAKSYDLKNWDRNDNLAGINLSDEGWDSEMIAYPHIFTLDNRTYMIYCGNYFGKSGFGYAILDQE